MKNPLGCTLKGYNLFLYNYRTTLVLLDKFQVLLRVKRVVERFLHLNLLLGLPAINPGLSLGLSEGAKIQRQLQES